MLAAARAALTVAATSPLCCFAAVCAAQLPLCLALLLLPPRRCRCASFLDLRCSPCSTRHAPLTA